MVKRLCLFLLTLFLFTGCANVQENEVNTQSQSSDQLHSEDKTDVSETSSQSENFIDIEKCLKSQTAKDSPSKTPPNNEGNSKWKPPGDTNEDTKKMTPCITYKQEGKKVHFTFSVKNNLNHLFTFHFDTAQQYDYTIKNHDGNVIRTYSKETQFPNLPGEHPVKPGGSVSYEVPVEDLQPGSYIITFVLTAKEMQPKTAIEFVVE